MNPDFLSGKKTYIVALGIIFVGVGSFAQGEVDVAGMLTYILNGLGLATLRLGVSKVG